MPITRNEWSWLTLGALPRRVSAARRSRYHHSWFDSTRPPFKNPGMPNSDFFFIFAFRLTYYYYFLNQSVFNAYDCKMSIHPIWVPINVCRPPVAGAAAERSEYRDAYRLIPARLLESCGDTPVKVSCLHGFPWLFLSPFFFGCILKTIEDRF